MVGEMREPEVMRLTLNAAETGHLVLRDGALVERGGGVAADRRVVPVRRSRRASARSSADCLVGVVAQRLRYREDLGHPGARVRDPHGEHAGEGAGPVRGSSSSCQSAIETGAADGSWTFARYGEWLSRKADWAMPGQSDEPAPAALPEPELAIAPPLPRPKPGAIPTKARPKPQPAQRDEEGVLVIPEQDDPEAILRELEGREEG